MNSEIPDLKLRPSQILSKLQIHWVGVMESGTREPTVVDGRTKDSKPATRANSRRSLSYFSLESLLLLLCLTASLLLLPLVLPPLPPPPFMLLLLPIGIFAVLLVLAFVPSDVRDIASSYV